MRYISYLVRKGLLQPLDQSGFRFAAGREPANRRVTGQPVVQNPVQDSPATRGKTPQKTVISA